jgi:outer membrane receptor protein involved in Fe transport
LNEIEVGTELRLLKNRFGLDVAYFHRKTKNEIINGNLSPATGFTSQYIATGSTQNQGLELSLNATISQSRNFNWNAQFNFTTVQNKILDIYGPDTTNKTLNFGGTYRPLNASLALVKGLPGPQVMAYDWKRDANGNLITINGVPQRTDKQLPMGTTLPKYYGGLTNNFTFRGINLSILVDYKFGNKVLSATRYYAIYRGLDKMTLPFREGGLTVDGVDQNGNKNAVNIDAQTYYQQLASVSKYEVLDGDFIKLRQVTLGYTFAENMLGRLPFQAITLSLVGRNLITFLKHTDNIDPESGFSSDVRYSGIEGTSLPSTRTYGVNINIKLKK